MSIKQYEKHWLGRTIRTVEKKSLKVSGSRAAATWFAIVLDDGEIILARPLKLCTVRDEAGHYFHKTPHFQRHQASAPSKWKIVPDGE